MPETDHNHGEQPALDIETIDTRLHFLTSEFSAWMTSQKAADPDFWGSYTDSRILGLVLQIRNIEKNIRENSNYPNEETVSLIGRQMEAVMSEYKKVSEQNLSDKITRQELTRVFGVELSYMADLVLSCLKKIDKYHSTENSLGSKTAWAQLSWNQIMKKIKPENVEGPKAEFISSLSKIIRMILKFNKEKKIISQKIIENLTSFLAYKN